MTRHKGKRGTGVHLHKSCPQLSEGVWVWVVVSRVWRDDSLEYPPLGRDVCISGWLTPVFGNGTVFIGSSSWDHRKSWFGIFIEMGIWQSGSGAVQIGRRFSGIRMREGVWLDLRGRGSKENDWRYIRKLVVCWKVGGFVVVVQTRYIEASPRFSSSSF